MKKILNTEDYIGKLLDDRYLIIEKIGEGGMAVVFKALDNRLEREVAVKILRIEFADDEEFVARFAAESHAVAMLSHPNIVGVYDVSHNDEIEYIVMELINGITLKQYLDKKGAVSWKEVLHFSKQIAAALSHAHERGIIHRDIKPHNIMLLKDGTIKVADFGIAALENEFEEAEGTAIGSLNYLSPEQTRGLGPDVRSDIYSLGVVMYEMLSGQKPYSGDSPGEISLKQKLGDIKPVTDLSPDTPESLCLIVEKAMAYNLNERYQTAADLAEDLDAFTVDYLKTEKTETVESPIITVKQDVKLSGKEYFKYLSQSTKAGFGFGSFGLMAACVLAFVLLWKFWLGEIFSPAQRIEMPELIGANYETISKDASIIGKYNFDVNYIVDTSVPAGTILKQNPVSGRSLMLSSDGIDVKLTVSTGYVLVSVPDVKNLDYREASLRLQNMGFSVEINNVTSADVGKNLVISSSPDQGEMISSGSVVYLDVSIGEKINYIKMPNIVGLSEDAAIYKLQQNNLNIGGTNRILSEYEAGTVIEQSVTAFTQVEEHTPITITVSSGSPDVVY